MDISMVAHMWDMGEYIGLRLSYMLKVTYLALHLRLHPMGPLCGEEDGRHTLTPTLP